MNTNITNDELLSKLQDLMAGKKAEPKQKLFTTCLYQKYLDQAKLHVESRDTLDRRIYHFINTFPFLPDEALPINTYINNLTRKNGKPMATESRKSYLNSIRTIINFAVANFNLTNYSQKLKMPSDKSTHLQKLDERTFWTPEQISWIINQIPDGQYKLLLLTLIDTDARIGEFGSTPEHDCLRANRIHPDIEQIEVYGKTGFHRKHCSKQLCEFLIQNANPNNEAIFHSKLYPNGVPSSQLRKNIWKYLNKIILKGYSVGIFQKTDKTGAHTIRHSVATFISSTFNNPQMVQHFLSHSDYKTSKLYVHLSEERKATLPSPLQLMGEEVKKNNKENKPQQTIMITDGTEQPMTTALAIPGQEAPIEIVEAVPDIATEMFPDIPTDFNIKRVYISRKELEAIITAARFYQRQSSQLDPIPGTLYRMFSHILQKSKKHDRG